MNKSDIIPFRLNSTLTLD